MIELGYKLSSEEHPPNDLVDNAVAAEGAGFSFALISDHFHPWTSKQGQSPFVWNVIGALARATTELQIGTGVTCPTIRIHPALVAQAAATSEAMMPGRFFLGVGSGENLNEHVLGDRWPPAGVRLEMLEEAVEVIRLLWSGEQESHHGRHYTVENARIYTLPDRPPPIVVAASGPKAARLAGRIGDGLVSTAPDEEVVKTFAEAGGGSKPRYAELQVCWAETEDAALDTAVEWWPNVDVPGELGQELPTPAHFEQAAENVARERIAEKVMCGPDPERHLDGIRKFQDAGFDHICVHQIGPDQRGFLEFYEQQVLPKLG